MQRVLQQDLAAGKKMIQSCRLVNRHWYRELTRYMVELTPRLTVFTFWDLFALRKFSNLKKLTLRDHSIVSDSWLHELPKVTPQLEALAIRFVSHSTRKGPFTRNGIQSLIRLEHLTHLEIAGSEFSIVQGIRTIATKTSLTYLDLSENGLTCRCIQPLTSLSNLETLILGGNDKLGDNAVRLMRQFTKLKRLSIRSCPHVSDLGVWTLSDLTAMTTLDLRMCTGIGGIGFSYCGQIPLLRLDLMGCSTLNDSNMLHIAKFRFIKFLDLRLCPRITDQGLEHLKNLSSIVDLRIGAGTKLISNQGLAFLPQLPCLERVTLFFMDGITYQGIESVYKVETLRKLTIIECTHLKREHLTQFLKKPPHLTLDLYPSTKSLSVPGT